MAVKNVLFKIQADTAQLRRELEAVKAGLGNIGTATKGAESQLTGLKKTLTGAAAAFGGVSLAASAIDFGKGAIEAVSNYETVQISLETFLGSAEKAKEVFEDLNQFSIKTPFTPEQVNQAGKALLAFGEPVDGLTTTLGRIGDVASATGKDFNELAVIYGKARVQGTLFAEDINQLTEAGIPIIGEFAKQLGVSETQVKKLGSEGQISFTNLEQAFKDLTTEGQSVISYFGLTEKLSQSTAGRLSTLIGKFDELKRSIGTGLLPIFETLTDAAFNFITAIQKVPAFVEENQTALLLLAGAVAFYVGQQKAAIQQQLIYELRFKALLIQEQIGLVVQRAKALFTRASATAKNILTTSTGLQTAATRAATIATTGFNAALKANPIGLVVSVLATAAALFVDFGDSVEETAVQTEKLLDSQTALTTANTEANAESAKSISELNKLVKEIKSANTGSAERKKLIDQLNGQYGTTLKNIGDEKKFIKDLDVQYQNLVNSIKQVAFAKAAEGQLVELTKQQLDLEEKLTLAKEGQAKADLKAQQKTTQFVSVTDQKIQLDNAAALQNQIYGNVSAIQAQYDATTKSIDDISKKIVDSGQTIKKVDGETSKSAEKTGDKRRELIQDLQREIRDLGVEVKKQPIEFIDAKTLDEQKTKIKALAQFEIDEIENTIKDRIQKAREAGTLTTTIEQQFKEVQRLQTLKVINDTTDEIDQVTKQAAEKRNQTLAEIRQIDLDSQLNEVEQNTAEIERQRGFLIEQFAAARTTAERNAIKEQLNANLSDLKDSIESEESLVIQGIESKRDAELLNVKLTADERVLIEKQADLDILKARQDFTDQILALDDEQTAESKKQADERKQAVLDGIEKVAKATVDLVNTSLNAAISETEGQINAQQKRVDAASKIAEKGNAELLQIEEDKLTKLNEKKANFVRTQQALAAIELVANSAVAISKAAAEGGAAAPFTIAATLIALAAGLVSARAQARAAASFATGGYTGDGGKYESAGTVHRGEFVITKEKTQRFRPLLEAIHSGRDPLLAKGLNGQLITMNNRSMDGKLDRIEKAIREQKGLNLSIDERGINGIVSNIQYKNNRIRNKAR